MFLRFRLAASAADKAECAQVLVEWPPDDAAVAGVRDRPIPAVSTSAKFRQCCVN